MTVNAIRRIYLMIYITGDTHGSIDIKKLTADFFPEGKALTKNDYVIVDSYRATYEELSYISSISRKVLYIDDFNRLNYPKGIILNPSLIMFKDSSDITDTFLGGPKHILLRDSFVDLPSKYPPKNITNILIVMGGTDPRNLMPRMIEILKHLSEYFIFVITNKNNINKYQKKYDNFSNIKFFSDLNAYEISKIMFTSDLAITGAGQTIFELIATKTPFIPVYLYENQKNIIKSLKEINPIQIIIDPDTIDFESSLLKAINYYTYIENRIYHLTKYNNLIDKFASKRILNELLSNE
jgi:spore coat polysaccharide biosynthesis predicted glycosyltransferase SpsG